MIFRVKTLRAIASRSILSLSALLLFFAGAAHAQQSPSQVPPPPPPPATSSDAPAQNPEQNPSKPAGAQAATPPIVSTTG
ncbi:MAG: hypothetical protein WCA34_02740, partial [Candidatus Acidiferrales bacterium]